MTGSRLCNWSDFETHEFAATMAGLGHPFLAHRKLWEEAAIIGAITKQIGQEDWLNKDGCGFGVGTEPLPSFFSEKLWHVLATDQAPGGEADVWNEGDQLCRGKESLYREFCPQWAFDSHLTFRRVDMRQIPPDLGTFDFLWSSSSLERLGSLEAGLAFLVESSRLLKPGGVAAHTTEFNLTSNDRTHDRGDVVVYRRRDIETLPDRLAAVGCTLDPVDWSLGDHEMDRLIDPMDGGKQDGKHVHLKLQLGEFAITSLLLVIRRPT